MAGAIAAQDKEELCGGKLCGLSVERQTTGVGARLSGAVAGNQVMTWRMLFIYGV